MILSDPIYPFLVSCWSLMKMPLQPSVWFIQASLLNSLQMAPCGKKAVHTNESFVNQTLLSSVFTWSLKIAALPGKAFTGFSHGYLSSLTDGWCPQVHTYKREFLCEWVTYTELWASEIFLVVSSQLLNLAIIRNILCAAPALTALWSKPYYYCLFSNCEV